MLVMHVQAHFDCDLVKLRLNTTFPRAICLFSAGRKVHAPVAQHWGQNLAAHLQSADRCLRPAGEAAASGAPALHVVYINTSLRTKALAHAAVPTITCTSSNVVQTVLQVRRPGSCVNQFRV